MFPFDKEVFQSSFKHAIVIGLLGFLFIFLVWKEIVVDDLVGMVIAIPMVAYLIHVIRLFK